MASSNGKKKYPWQISRFDLMMRSMRQSQLNLSPITGRIHEGWLDARALPEIPKL
jgi:hypothetical protein